MAEAQANLTQEECDLEAEEELFNLKLNLTISNSDLQDYTPNSQDYDDGDLFCKMQLGILEIPKVQVMI